MCCRIFNTTSKGLEVTGRNMNWPFPVDAHLYLSPAGVKKQGISDNYARDFNIDAGQVFRWRAKYASISTILSGVHTNKTEPKSYDYQGFEQACADGINEMGLVVNALADSEVDYGTKSNKKPLMSSLCWSQYILDKFATVEQAVKALAKPKYRLVDQGMPDDSGNGGKFHLCLSDAKGDSAVIEYDKGKPKVYFNPETNVVTNNPNYPAQLILNDYWQFQWGISNITNNNPLYTAPGGVSSTQMFERASFYFSFCKPLNTLSLAIAQTRNLMSSVALPIEFNKTKYKKDEKDKKRSVYTTWTNLAANRDRRYYFINNLVGNLGYVDFAMELSECRRVKVMNRELEAQEQFTDLNGNLNAQLQPSSEVPFQRTCV